MNTEDANAYKLGPEGAAIDKRVRCTWVREWGGRPKGFTVTGILKESFAVRGGRVLIGYVWGTADTDSVAAEPRTYSVPFSRNYLAIEVLS